MEPKFARYTKSRISILKSQELLSSCRIDSLYDSRMEPDFDIAKWVKTARTHANQSQEALGERMGKTKGNISAWENGRHEPSFKQVLQISSITGYPLPSNIGLKIDTPPAANDAHQVDADEIIDVIRGYQHATRNERLAILDISRVALRRASSLHEGSATD